MDIIGAIRFIDRLNKRKLDLRGTSDGKIHCKKMIVYFGRIRTADIPALQSLQTDAR